MHAALLLLASSPLAAAAAAKMASRPPPNAHQIPFSEPFPQDGPGPFNADQHSSVNPASSALEAAAPSSAAASRTYFSLCAGAEGTVQTINDTPYRTYCYNSLWGNFVGLGYHNDIESCEKAFTSSTVKPKVGYHWYPSTGACYLFNTPTDQLYVYHYGNYEKVFFAPVDISTPPDGPVCPLSNEGGWLDIAGERHRLFCRGMAKADAKDVRDYGKATVNMTECAKWSKSVGGKMWHWWQPYQDAAPGLATGQRNCEAIMKMPERLVPLRTKDTYIAGVPESQLVDAIDIHDGMEIK